MRSLRLPIALFVFTLTLLPAGVFAADPQAFCINPEFYKRISQYYNLAVAFAILSAIFMIVYGGYRMVVSIGRPGLIEVGKKVVQNAIIGLIIAITSAIILNILNPRILNQSGEQCQEAAMNAGGTGIRVVQTEVLA
jgi:F0F1-type ATP synthase assembly protein I